jgi:hypothetical protein
LIFCGCQKSGKTIISVTPDIRKTGFVLPGITATAFSLEDIYMAAGTGEGSLMIWNISRGKRIQAIRAGDSAVTAVAFSPDNWFVAAGMSSGEITVWEFARNAATESAVNRVFGTPAGAAIVSIQYNEKGDEIVALSRKGEIIRWNSASGEELSRDAAIQDAFAAAALGEGQILYGRGKNLRLIDFPGGGEMGRFTGDGSITGTALGGNTFAAGSKGVVQIWNETDGEPQRIRVADKVTVLAVNGSETRLLTGSKDGVTRMWDIATGTEIARYISFGTADEAGEWICMLPSGYYNASARGDALMKVAVNGETYSMAQFSNALFRPDILSKAIREGTYTGGETLASLLADDLPPLVEIMRSTSLTVSEGNADIRIKITVRAGGIGHLQVYKNPGETLIGYLAVEHLIVKRYTERGRQIYEAECTAPVEQGPNNIGVRVFGERRRVSSRMAEVNINSTWAGPGAGKPDLHVLLMSIEKYKNGKNSKDIGEYDNDAVSHLQYTTKDADDIGKLFESQKRGSLYRDVKIYQYKDERITKKEFLNIFKEVSGNVGRKDNFIFFFSGHGFVDNRGDYFFVPHDSVGFVSNKPEDNILMDDIVSGVTGVYAKNSLILLDTCQSGTLLASEDTAFNRLVRSLKRPIITAALGHQSAGEAASIGNGIFTRSVITSFEDNPEKQYSQVADVIEFTGKDVPAQFAAISVSGSRGQNRTLAGYEIQRPMASMPGYFTDFEFFDKYTEPGIVEITSVNSPGTVSIFGLPGENTTVRAGQTIRKRLTGGNYSVSIQYGNGFVQTEQVEVRNISLSKSYVPPKSVVTFNYSMPAALAPTRSSPMRTGSGGSTQQPVTQPPPPPPPATTPSGGGTMFTQRGMATQEMQTDGLTIAHPTLPIGSKVWITNPANRKEVEATVTGRIPASASRVVDVSPGVALALDLGFGGEVILTSR